MMKIMANNEIIINHRHYRGASASAAVYGRKKKKCAAKWRKIWRAMNENNQNICNSRTPAAWAHGDLSPSFADMVLCYSSLCWYILAGLRRLAVRCLHRTGRGYSAAAMFVRVRGDTRLLHHAFMPQRPQPFRSCATCSVHAGRLCLGCAGRLLADVRRSLNVVPHG